MPLSTIVLALIGLVGILAGGAAFYMNGQYDQSDPPAERKRVIRNRKRALAAGFALGLASWPLTYLMGYPFKTSEGIVRIVGIPFYVAHFDSAGRDYISFLTLPGVIGNGVFWCLIPQFLLMLADRSWRRM